MRLEDIDDLLTRLGPELDPLGITAFDQPRAWGIALNEDVSLLIDFDVEASKIVLSGEVGIPPAGDRSTLYELLLRHNFLWHETGGVRLALDGADGAVVQIADISTQGLDVQRLVRSIRIFADAIRAWREIIRRPTAKNDHTMDYFSIPLIRV